MSWKEQFDKELAKFKKGDDAVAFTKDFISTEIIKKLIADIESTEILYRSDYANDIVFDVKGKILEQLRAKWL